MAFIGNQIITLNSLLDLDGQELVLDADADTTIHVSTDDQIDFKIAGTDFAKMSDQTLTLTSATASRPGLLLLDTNADANPPFLRFQKDSASPADNDEVGVVQFYADDDGGNVFVPSQIKVVATDVSNGSEDGKMTISTTAGGSLTDTLVLESGNTTVSGTLASTGVLTANAGVVVDNITIDGTEIDLSSGDLTIDVAGDITLDANGQQIFFAKGGTTFGQFGTESTPSNYSIESTVSDGDIIFKGNDGGSTIEIARFDVSEGGDFLLNKTSSDAGTAGHELLDYGRAVHTASATTVQVVNRLSSDGAVAIFQKDGGTVLEISSSSGDVLLDAPQDIILDVDGGDVHFQDSGSSNRFVSIKNSSGSCIISNPFADGDITLQGNDAGVGAVNALVLDMSAGGEASFSNDVNVTFQRGYQVEGGTGNNKVRFTTTTGDGGANTVLVYWTATYGNDMSGGCLGAYNRSGVYSAPSASITSSSHFAIYGVIGVS